MKEMERGAQGGGESYPIVIEPHGGVRRLPKARSVRCVAPVTPGAGPEPRRGGGGGGVPGGPADKRGPAGVASRRLNVGAAGPRQPLHGDFKPFAILIWGPLFCQYSGSVAQIGARG